MSNGEGNSSGTNSAVNRHGCPDPAKASRFMPVNRDILGRVDSTPLPASRRGAAEDDASSRAEGAGIIPKKDCYYDVSNLPIPCESIDRQSEVSEERTHAFLIDPPPGSCHDNDLMALGTPRAGQIRIPYSTGNSGSRHSSAPCSSRSCRRSVATDHHLHRSLSIRAWNHDDDGSNNAADDSVQTAEVYLHSRRNPSLVSHHQPSSVGGSLAAGTISPQFWRGETIEETLSPRASPARSPGQIGISGMFSDLGPFCSGISSRRSSVLHGPGKRPSIFSAGVRQMDSTAGSLAEELLVAGPKRRPVTVLSHEANTRAPDREEFESTQKLLITRMDQIGAKVNQMEMNLLIAIEKLGERVSNMEQRMSELHEQRESVDTHAVPSTSRDVSLGGTREPSRAIDF